MNFKDSEHLIPIFDFDLLNLQLNTPLFIFALVLIVMLAMNKLLFQPVLRTLEERKAFLDGLNENAERQKEEITRLAETYEQDLEKVRGEVAQVRADARRESQQAIEAVLYKARQAADEDLREALAELNGEVEQAKGELALAARSLAEKTANQILSAS
jgi:F-type H+-transporting ATPase subunit b